MTLLTRLSLVFLAALTGHAATYYVAPAPAGNDSNDGSITAPFATVWRAANLAGAGNVVYLRAGTYHQHIWADAADFSGTAARPLTISGYPGEEVVIDGQDTVPVAAGSALFYIGGSYVIIQDLTIQNSFGAGLAVFGSHNIIRRVKANGNYENGILITGRDTLVEDCEAYYNAKNHEKNTWRVDRGGFWSGGISVTAQGVANGATQNTLRRDKVWNTWGEGIAIFGGASYTTVEDCVIYDNQAGIYINNSQHNTIRRNLVYLSEATPMTYGTPSGISMNNEEPGPFLNAYNTIINNLVVNHDRNFVWWGDKHGGGLNNDVIDNNTFVNARMNVNIQIAAGAHANSQFQNNLVLQEGPLRVAAGFPGGTNMAISHNLWSMAPPARFSGIGDVLGDPQLAKTGSLDAGLLTAEYFRISATSPAVARGIAVAEVTSDFFGNPMKSSPDIGAIAANR